MVTCLSDDIHHNLLCLFTVHRYIPSIAESLGELRSTYLYPWSSRSSLRRALAMRRWHRRATRPFQALGTRVTDPTAGELQTLMNHLVHQTHLAMLSQAMKNPTKWAVYEVKELPTFVSGRVAILGDAVSNSVCISTFHILSRQRRML